VNASGSSLVGGEYVAVFIADPTDKPPLRNATAWVKAHQGSVISSWWKSINVIGPCPPQMMYTSFEETEPRFSSPGRFVLCVVNPPSADTTLSLSLDWAVDFSQPSLEIEEEIEAVHVLNTDARLSITGGGASGNAFDPHLRKDFINDKLLGDVALYDGDFSPLLPPGAYLKLPHPHSLSSDTGSSGAPEGCIVTHMGVDPAVINMTRPPGTRTICYFYTFDDKTFSPLEASFPFSSRPMTDQLTLAGEAMEAETAFLEGSELLGRQSGPQPSTSALRYNLLSTGKLLSFNSSGRY
jgi:hypothetical protein